MKILKANGGVLTNFEVLDFLRSRGAGKDPTRVIAPIAPSEFKVYDYLEQTAASIQTRENIHEFVEKSKKYNLLKAETLSIINITPSSAVEIDPILKMVDTGGKKDGEAVVDMGDRVEELVELVAQVLPLPPSRAEEPDEGVSEDEELVPEGQQVEDIDLNV